MKVQIDDGAYAPTRAHGTDAGMDLRAPADVLIPAHGSAVIQTGVHVQLPAGHCGLLISRSGLNVRFGITSRGLIDEGYTGEIQVRLDNSGDTYYQVHAGEKISQLVVVPCRYEPIELVDQIEGGERGDAGFGSTGR